MTDVAEVAQAASTLLGAQLLDPEDLGGSARSTVLRCRVGGDAGSTVVVKQFHGEDDGGYDRERTGLTLLDRTPDLVAADGAQRLLVMSDLGDPPTLADLLLGADREAAWSGASGWARELGRLAGSGRHQVDEARELLGARPWDVVEHVTRGAARLGELLGGAARIDRLHAEAREVATAFTAGSGPVVLAPSDSCPDNAVLRPDGWWFLDLEGTVVQPPAFVAAYTMLPFATCWCVFDPPAGLTDTLLAEFTAGLEVSVPGLVAHEGWQREVERASGAYVLAMTGWLLDSTLAGREHVGPAGRSPSYRQLMTSRWRWAAVNLRTAMPELAATCGAAARWATEAWGGETEPTGYPAFAA
ncbi:hypothetical protein [Isoptericola sp. 178]|uniref:hypothetical protein n=1 Tax=Isoptericola sp. 178 TaxID=3064651 RepID=UPI002713A63C|nr:hypothetical protein [Isoptericola sp. 178]MDO8144636.1 hypothetical protein [Isoptericola sp. 178]